MSQPRARTKFGNYDFFCRHRLMRPYLDYTVANSRSNLLMISTGMGSRPLMLEAMRIRIENSANRGIFIDRPALREDNNDMALKLGCKDDTFEIFSIQKLVFHWTWNNTFPFDLSKTDIYVMLQSVGQPGTKSYALLEKLLKNAPNLHLLMHGFDAEKKFYRLMPKLNLRIVPSRQSAYFYPIFGNPNPFGPFGSIKGGPGYNASTRARAK